jgi:hypothetical protein
MSEDDYHAIGMTLADARTLFLEWTEFTGSINDIGELVMLIKAIFASQTLDFDMLRRATRDADSVCRDFGTGAYVRYRRSRLRDMARQ